MAGKPGVVFDVDGTLLDTNYLHTVAWTRALRSHGYDEVTMEHVHGAIGIASAGLVEHVTGGQDEAVTDAHSQEYEAFQDDVRAFPRAADLMRACHGLGLLVVIATSGKEKDLDWMLPAIGIEDDIVEAASTSSDVDSAKPAPDLMQVAMDTSDLDPDRTVAIGDTVWDVQAAARAGIRCIALTCGGIGEAALRDAGAVEVWRDPADLLAHLDDSVLADLARSGADD
ncbi:HAD family hydrolase [Mobilicoccus caccae]|uniref:Haloacid dehalogenase n=1 Tax=Mobilicoccus caccae TaxID=1859295 RepID=A0ABQ6IQR3_9MICO|nr:HAD family hydrolase [Mobilicoccus caccae]GMA39613.1 haloacid dehalogenase [Mobilicoccus caccae]